LLKKICTFTAIAGSEEPSFPAKETHNPSTSERVVTEETAFFVSIPNLMARTIWKMGEKSA
jgi:hypothetical protein